MFLYGERFETMLFDKGCQDTPDGKNINRNER